MSNFLCPDCQAPILEGPDGLYVTGCQHHPLPGGEWISRQEHGLPDFMKFGFHRGKLLDIRRAKGVEMAGAQYQGYGMFGPELFEDVTHWRPHG